MLKIKKAKFLISSPNLALCPKLDYPEFALLGRSNVGKSSFINKFTNNFKLAKTSNTPGKTRLINLFEINESFIFADLPGYGFAKVSKTEQNLWQKNLEEYLKKRENLKSAIQFIDARHDIQNNDFQMHDWLILNSVPYFVVMTKCDYVSKSDVKNKISRIKNYFKTDFVYPFSIKDNYYNKEIFNYIESILN